MKILSATEVKQRLESERIKEITRTESTRIALSSLQQELSETEAKFELALAKQQQRYLEAEQTATEKLNTIYEQIKKAARFLSGANIPIENNPDLADNNYQDTVELLQKRLDELAERETELELREQKLTIREEAIEKEREFIKNLYPKII